MKNIFMNVTRLRLYGLSFFMLLSMSHVSFASDSDNESDWTTDDDNIPEAEVEGDGDAAGAASVPAAAGVDAVLIDEDNAKRQALLLLLYTTTTKLYNIFNLAHKDFPKQYSNPDRLMDYPQWVLTLSNQTNDDLTAAIKEVNDKVALINITRHAHAEVEAMLPELNERLQQQHQKFKKQEQDIKDQLLAARAADDKTQFNRLLKFWRREKRIIGENLDADFDIYPPTQRAQGQSSSSAEAAEKIESNRNFWRNAALGAAAVGTAYYAYQNSDQLLESANNLVNYLTGSASTPEQPNVEQASTSAAAVPLTGVNMQSQVIQPGMMQPAVESGNLIVPTDKTISDIV